MFLGIVEDMRRLVEGFVECRLTAIDMIALGLFLVIFRSFLIWFVFDYFLVITILKKLLLYLYSNLKA